jgi:hypothetical protein
VKVVGANFEVADAVGLNPTDLGCLCLLFLHGPSRRPTGRTDRPDNGSGQPA